MRCSCWQLLMTFPWFPPCVWWCFFLTEPYWALFCRSLAGWNGFLGQYLYRYILSGMNIHKSQLFFWVNKRYQGFDPSPNLSCPVGFSPAEELPRTRRPPAPRRDIGRQPRGAGAGLGGWRWRPGEATRLEGGLMGVRWWTIHIANHLADDFAGWKSGIVPMAFWIHLYNPLRTKSLYHYILSHSHRHSPIDKVRFIELDDGTILTGNPYIYLMVKTHGFPVKIFPQTNPLNVLKIPPSTRQVRSGHKPWRPLRRRSRASRGRWGFYQRWMGRFYGNIMVGILWM